MLKNSLCLACHAAAAHEMFYPQELLPRPRARPALYGNCINETQFLRRPDQRRARFCRGCGECKLLGRIISYFKEFCGYSSMHGMRYLTDPRMCSFERYLWLLILMGTFLAATLVYVDLNELYTSVRIQTTIENSFQPVFYVQFPSVGLCPRNRVNRLKLEQEAPEHFLGANATAQQKEVFRSFFSAAAEVHIDDMQSLSRFFRNETLAANVSQLNGYDVARVLQFVQMECSEIFAACIWRGNARNCCDVLELQHTEFGICWVFNSAVSEQMRERQRVDKFYPRRTAQSGPGTGFEVTIRLNRSLALAGRQGVHVMIKHPQQWSDIVRLLPYGSYNRVSVTPRLTASDERTRVLAPEVRHCIFTNEWSNPHYKNFPGFVYWRGNCRSRCHQEYVVKLCKCSPKILFPVIQTDNFTDCTASDFECLYEHRSTFATDHLSIEHEYVGDIYNNSMNCDCFNSCSQQTYDTFFSYAELKDESAADMLMRLDIFFSSPWFIKHRMHMRFTFVELLANFGGIIGLFLGASLISAIELFYYFTIGLYMYIYRRQGKCGQQSQHPPVQLPITVRFQHKITPRKITY